MRLHGDNYISWFGSNEPLVDRHIEELAKDSNSQSFDLPIGSIHGKTCANEVVIGITLNEAFLE